MKTIHITPLPAGEGQGGGALWVSSFYVYIQKKKDDTNHSHRPLKE